MKPALLTAYAENLPRLEAEEDLRLVSAVTAGAGHMKKGPRQDYLRDLERQARGHVPAVKATPQDAAALGIRVRKVPKRG